MEEMLICPKCKGTKVHFVENKYEKVLFCENIKCQHYFVYKTKQNKIDEKCVPKCPTCGSSDLSKVSTMAKAGSVMMWGLLSQKVKKTWHCNNCKYEW